MTLDALTGCACVSHDPHDCARIRYRRCNDLGSDDLEPCECMCHDEWDEIDDEEW